MMNEQFANTPLAHTCLFTGEVLPAHTKQEHTIQRSLAGRIRSRWVSSNAFNKAAGDGVDMSLAAIYAPLFNRLGPITPSEHSAPSLPAGMYGSEKKYVMGEGMVLRQKDVVVERHDPTTGRPALISAPTQEAWMKFAKSSKIDPAGWKFTPEHSASGLRGWLDFSGFDPAAEIAILKASLLTFDHMLEGDQERRFTRHPDLSRVRNFVRTAVLEKQWSGMAEFVLGLQYDSLREIKRLRDKIAGQRSDFEHVLIATTNSMAGCLDILFWIASVDPFAFRLCRPWKGDSFTCVVVSGTLKGTETIGPIWLPEQIHFRPKPHLASVRTGVSAEQALSDARRAAGEMSIFRIEALREAADLVERTCDEFVREGLRWDARLLAINAGFGLIADAVRRRLEALYALPISNPQKKKQFEEAVERRFSGTWGEAMAESIRKDNDTDGRISWSAWLALYRVLLSDMTELFGLPGEIEPSGTDVEFLRAENGPAKERRRVDTSPRK